MYSTDQFWADVLSAHQSHPESRFVDGGGSFLIGPGNAPENLRGYGGRLVEVTFPDGRVVVTNNLWSNGSIPEDKLPLFTNHATIRWL
jgi:hypothetical protein